MRDMPKSDKKDHLKQGSEVSSYEALVSGSFSGAIARLVAAPIDLLKIRLQLSIHEENRGKLVHIVKDIYSKEGLRAFWKGNVPAEFLYIFYGATQFTSYTIFNNFLGHVNEKFSINVNPSAHSLISGMCAGLTSTLITYPFDLLRTRLTVNVSPDLLSMTSISREVYSKQKLKGFFYGIKPTLLSITMSTGVMFWSYELCRDLMSGLNSEIPFVEGICGFIAGVTSKGIVFPLDTVRKRMQVGSTSNLGSEHSIFLMVRSILRKHGILGLYRGFGLSILKSGPTSAISLYIYERTITVIRKMRGNEN